MLGDVSGLEKIYIVCGYTDMRKSIDGLCTVIEDQLKMDPSSSALFLFCGRRRDRIKALYWEGNGFLLLYKRLESGIFQWPRKESEAKVEETGSVLLSSKVAEKLAKMPVQIRFNRDCTAIQICAAGSADSVTFPKSGRKAVPNAAKILRENRIQFPAIFNGEICGENTKWRGERQVNPTGKPSQTIRSTRKK